MIKLSVFVTFIMTVMTAWGDEQFLYAITDLEPLLETHKNVIDRLEQYLQREKKKHSILEKYLNMFKKEQKKMDDEKDYIKNPINAFSLIRRLQSDLDMIEYYANMENAFERNKDMVYPKYKDTRGAALALWRLPNMYGLDVRQFAAGNLIGTYSQSKKLYVEKSNPLTRSDCFLIGYLAYEMKDYYASLLWLNEALTKFYNRDPEDISYLNVTATVERLQKAYTRKYDLDTEKDSPEISEDGSVSDVTVERYLYQNLSDVKYISLCRGQVLLPQEKIKDLYCYYKTSPLFRQLIRIKTELLYRNPDIYRFYDVISDEDSKGLLQLVKPKLKKATVGTTLRMILPCRISKLGWLNDSVSSLVKRITRVTEDLSGLSATTAEMLQVNNYGIGGHFHPHFDFSDQKEDKVHRAASVLFYLSETEQGGATVFVDLNITVFPIKNSAIFWMNTLSSGENDYRTRHAGCPVLRGSKWVAIKWFSTYGQEFIRPCSLFKEENPVYLKKKYSYQFEEDANY